MDNVAIYGYRYVFAQKLGEYIGYNLAVFAVPIITFIVLYLLGRVASYILINILDKLVKKTKIFEETNILDNIVKPVKGILTLTAALVAVMTSIGFVQFKMFTFLVYRVGIIFFITKGIVASMDGIFKVFMRFGKNSTETISDTVVLFLSKIAKFLIITLSVLIIMSEFGIDVNGIIAGLGLGGVTFALAAKETASNMFGGFNIIVDKPFVVGDWIATSTIEGIVEDITFRSTRIRTFFDSVIVVPNNTLANDNITNWAQMNKRRDSFQIGLIYSTPKAVLQEVMEAIKESIIRHEDVIDDTVLVNLEGFSESSIDIKIIYFIDKLTFIDAKRVREDVNFMILDIVHSKGASFAFPTRTIFMGE